MQSASRHNLYILVFIFGFILATLVASFFYISPLISVFIILLGASVPLIEKTFKGNIEKEVMFLSIGLIAFGFGILRFDIKDFHEDISPAMHGVVISEPEKREKDERFILKSDNGEKILISTNLYNEIFYGDEVNISGKLERPGIIDDGISRPFDYGAYLAKDNIYNTMSFAQVEVVDHGKGNIFKAFLLKIKGSFVSKIRDILSEPESSLLAGLIISGKDALPQSILDEFKRAGVIHIVVLSGYNITIVAEFLRKIFSLFSLRLASFGSIFGILAFVLMAGGTSTVIRAAIMALIATSGKILGRTYSVPRALLIAAFLMLLENPKILVFDPSFQLSFLATIGLVFVSPIVERWLKKVPEKWGIRNLFGVTIGTQITVFPYLLYSMGAVSIVSLISNILILPIVPYTMLIGLVSAVISYISTIIVLPITYISHIMLKWILFVAHILGNLSWASIQIPNFSIWITLIIYTGLVSIWWRLQNSIRPSASLS